MGVTNVDTNTGIRYGVAAMNGDYVSEWLWEEFYASGTNETEAEALAEWEAENPDADEAERYEWFESCEFDECDWSLELYDGAVALAISWLGGAPLLWVLKSPVRCFTGDCSPCVPGAGDLDHSTHNYSPDGDTYALPLEWRRERES